MIPDGFSDRTSEILGSLRISKADATCSKSKPKYQNPAMVIERVGIPTHYFQVDRRKAHRPMTSGFEAGRIRGRYL